MSNTLITDTNEIIKKKRGRPANEEKKVYKYESYYKKKTEKKKPTGRKRKLTDQEREERKKIYNQNKKDKYKSIDYLIYKLKYFIKHYNLTNEYNIKELKTMSKPDLEILYYSIYDKVNLIKKNKLNIMN